MIYKLRINMKNNQEKNNGHFSIFTLCGGLAFFLYGMIVMSAGLEKIAGGKMEKMLEK